MKNSTVEIKLQNGLEARPVAMLVQVAASLRAGFIWNPRARRSMPRASWE